eukprot:GHVQ01014980.1.p1 GENE.GHVQ01014980.1~~GHVQ01014980.1.p1  ORF type:complete len:767 (+),score=87.73 GHVQ01014980.1:177-2477(+)
MQLNGAEKFVDLAYEVNFPLRNTKAGCGTDEAIQGESIFLTMMQTSSCLSYRHSTTLSSSVDDSEGPCVQLPVVPSVGSSQTGNESTEHLSVDAVDTTASEIPRSKTCSGFVEYNQFVIRGQDAVVSSETRSTTSSCSAKFLKSKSANFCGRCVSCGTPVLNEPCRRVPVNAASDCETSKSPCGEDAKLYNGIAQAKPARQTSKFWMNEGNNSPEWNSEKSDSVKSDVSEPSYNLVYEPKTLSQTLSPPAQSPKSLSPSRTDLPGSSVSAPDLSLDKVTQEEFSLRFGLSELVLKAYRCALSRKILLQGRMYISQNYLGFFSVFNDMTVFGGDTTVLFPLCDVRHIRKKVNALFFDNSIEFELMDGTTHFFATFLHRDKAYDFIYALREIHKRMTEAGVSCASQAFTAVTSFSGDDCGVTAEGGGRSPSLPPSQKFSVLTKIQVSTTAGYNPEVFDSTYSIPDHPAPTKALKHTEPGLIWNVNITDLFSAAFDNFELDSNPYARVLKAHNAGGFEAPPPWDKPPPPPFGCGKIDDSRPGRSLQYDMDFKQTALTQILRFPSRGSAVETFCLYVLSRNCFIVESVLQLEGMPLADCFKTRSRCKATALSERSTQLDGEFEVEFYKSTMFSGKIEAETMSQLKSNFHNFLQWTTDCLVHKLGTDASPAVHALTPMNALSPRPHHVPDSETETRTGLKMPTVLYLYNIATGISGDFLSLFTNRAWRSLSLGWLLAFLFVIYTTWRCIVVERRVSDIFSRLENLEETCGG